MIKVTSKLKETTHTLSILRLLQLCPTPQRLEIIVTLLITDSILTTETLALTLKLLTTEAAILMKLLVLSIFHLLAVQMEVRIQ